MLDNEPTNGAEGTAGTTETTDHEASPPRTGNGEVRVTTPAPAKGARRAAGPPPEPDEVFSAPSEPATSLAGSGEGGTVKTAVTTPTSGRRTVRAAGRPEDAPAPRRRRTRAAAKDTVETAEPVPESSEQVTDSRTDTTVEETPGEGATVFRAPGMLFQPPVAQESPVRTAQPADRGVAETEESETDDEQAAQSTGTEEGRDPERPSRRRRRRGGRGRGRSRSGEEITEDTEAPEPAENGRQVGEEDGKDDNDAESSSEEERGSRRRRRRRRRTGSSDDSIEDDPPNTVVKVREPRQERPIEDEVQAVRGSTRLEAKKQRRREGREQGRRRTPIVTESEFLARREAVKRDLVIRRASDRTQIAVLEDDVLVEHYVDRATHRSYVGNVYLGRVQNVLPSMEAAFVDIGKGRNAVLYAGEVNWDVLGVDGQPKRIESVLKSGQSVLVQVTKDPVGHKGARLTSQISLPGRYLVYVPGGSMTGISRKLPDKERARLKQILKKVMPSGAGVIVRTAAEGASEEELERDISRLAKQWDSIQRKSKSASSPALLNSEPDLTIRVIRDVFNEDFSSLVVSGDEAWNTVHEYVEHVAPNLSERLSHWNENQDVFAAYRVDEQINKALERKVWLPSGGSLIIDRTEAMTVVDVNTGKFTGQGGNLEETVTKNNLEAAEEIVRQLRLRDIGGIIVIDFIDMVLESNRDLVLRRMLECLSRDRTKHQVAEVTSLGLVQMTRKRVGQGLLEAFSHTCEHCNGRGLLLSGELTEGKNGNGSRKKKKDKAKGEAEQQSDKADKQPEKAEKKADKKTDKKSVKDKSEETAAPEQSKSKTKSKKSTSRKTAKDDVAEVSEPAEPSESTEVDAAGESASEPVKKTRKRTSRPRKSAETEEAAESVQGEPGAAEEETSEKEVEAVRSADETASEASEEATPTAETEAPAEDESDEETEERPKRRRTRRTKTATSTTVDAG